MGTGFSLGGVETVLELDRGGGLYNSVSIKNATELYSLVNSMLRNFTSIKKKKDLPFHTVK